MTAVTEIVVKASLVLAAAIVATFVLRRRSAALRHWILAVGIVCATLTPVLVRVAPGWSLPLAVAAPSLAPQSELVSMETTLRVAAAVPPAPAAEARALSAAMWLSAIWAVGALTGLLVLAVGLARLAWLAARSSPLVRGHWTDLAHEVSTVYGLRRPLRLLQSQHPSLLVTWGVWRPIVMLPPDATQWSAARIRIVLAHELAHVARGDWVAQLAAECLRAVYWFNPLAWIAGRRLRDESERACDDLVIASGIDGTEYATELVALARTLRPGRQAWIPAPAMARQSNLERRVAAMLSRQINRRPLSRVARASSVALVLAVALAVGGYGAFAQGFFSFSGAALDSTGGRVPGVTLTLTNRRSGQKYEVTSNATGGFEFVGLTPGQYDLQTRLAGFNNAKQPIAIDGRNLQRDVQLQVGTLEETITVDNRQPRSDDTPKTPVVRSASVLPKPAACEASATGGRILPPKKIADARPIYPANLGEAFVSDVIELEALIGTDGAIKDVRAIDPSAQPDLVNAASDAVRLWRYTQTLLNCVPIEVSMRVHVAFRTAPPPPSAPPPAPR